MRSRWVVLAVWAVMAGWADETAAQSLGTFSWQLEPFCNVVTVSVTQNGGVYTLDGFDAQCGAPQRAPLVGMAAPNPDGTMGLAFSIVTVPGGRPVHVDARINLTNFGGPWSDSAGNAGTLVFGGQGAGVSRPLPTAPLTAVPPGSVGAVQIVPGGVGALAIADGSVGAADVNAAQVQLRLNGTCPSGQFLMGVDAAGTLNCRPSASGGSNTALGTFALQSTVLSDRNNTAMGNAALRDNTTGSNNVAVGQAAMLLTTTAQQNVAVGGGAMLGLTSGPSNVAVGHSALSSVVTGGFNVGVGFAALFSTTGTANTAVGYQAGRNMTTGGGNIALGYNAGANVTTGLDNIHIGHQGSAADTVTIRIGSPGLQSNAYLAGVRGQITATMAIPVVIGTDGELGTTSSSRRYKEDIRDMGQLSARLFGLRPVTFRYTQPMTDGSRPLDFGLIAEEVSDVMPELAVWNADGQIETVAYHKLPALLLNEMQKQQRTIDRLTSEMAELRRLLDQLNTDARR